MHSTSLHSTSGLDLEPGHSRGPWDKQGSEPPTPWAVLWHPSPGSAGSAAGLPSLVKTPNNSLFRLDTTSPGKEREPVPQPCRDGSGQRGCAQGCSLVPAACKRLSKTALRQGSAAAPASLERHRWSLRCGSSAAQPAFPGTHLALASTKVLLRWLGSPSLMNPSWETFFFFWVLLNC